MKTREPEWVGWASSQSRYGNPSRRYPTPGIGGYVMIAWGRADRHGVWSRRGQERFAAGGWGPGVRWYVDLELHHSTLPEDENTAVAAHIERGYRDLASALAMRDWLRSCVEVAGEAGLRALNARTGGRLA